MIWIRETHLDGFQTSALMNRLDVYVSLHRSEGFGLTMAEAMAFEKPVIATGYSANVEFMDDSCSRLVHHREVVTNEAHGAYPRGTRWAEPDVEHAADLMRSLHLDNELRRDLGRRAKRRIEQTLSPEAVAKTLRARLGWDGEAEEPRAADSTRADQARNSEERLSRVVARGQAAE